jgi:hypothetical protein
MRLSAKIKGEKREKHFAHAVSPCGGETYVHSAAKRLFKQRFDRAIAEGIPFVMPFQAIRECPHGHRSGTLLVDRDITRALSEATLEYVYRSWRFDVWLQGNDRCLAVEMVKTHGVDFRKRVSDVPMVEMDVQNDLDLSVISEGNLRDLSIRYHGIPPLTEKLGEDDCPKCQHGVAKARSSRPAVSVPKAGGEKLLFVVQRNGRCWIRPIEAHRVEEEIRLSLRYGARVAEAHPLTAEIWNQWKTLARKASSEGIPVKSCLVCVHGDLANVRHKNGPFWCYAKGRHYSTKKALICSDFSRR